MSKNLSWWGTRFPYCWGAGGIYVTSAEVAAEEGRQVISHHMVKVSETEKPKLPQHSGQVKVGSNSWEFSWEGLLNEATKHDIQYWLYMEWLMISQAALKMSQSNPRKRNLPSHLTYLCDSSMFSQNISLLLGCNTIVKVSHPSPH